MSSIFLSSNANSSMLQTVESSDSRKNPNIYSTETVFPAHALTWVECASNSGSIGNGQQLNFNLQKYGIISQMLLCYEKNSSITLPAGDFFKTIKQVELLASSKTVAILTAEDFMAQFSDCSQSEFNVISETVLKESTKVTGKNHKYTVPLTWGQCEQINNQLDSSFLEPLSVRISFNTIKTGSGTYPATDAAAMPKCFLKIRYKNYDEPSTAEMISSNYSSPQLNQLTTRYYSESKVPQSTSAAGTTSVTVELKNTECVEAFYVMVRKVLPLSGTGSDVAYALTPIDQVTFLGSGQEICKLDSQQLAYARLSKDGWSESVDVTTTGSGVNVNHVAKIQLGLNSKQMMTNALSLREINNGQIVVEWTTGTDTATNWEVCVVERVLAVYATSASSGRYSLALAN